MELSATANGVKIRLDATSLRVGERRIPRDRITGVECGPGTMVFTGEVGALARVDFQAAERRS